VYLSPFGDSGPLRSEDNVPDPIPTGEALEFIPVVELAKLAGYTRARIYQLIKDGRGPVLQPHHKGIALPEAVVWLKRYSRRAKRTARVEAVKRLRALCEAVDAAEGGA
jgi:predicted DNA-binding transcriptional regulator AlpA